MARRKIYREGDDTLRQISKPVTEFDDGVLKRVFVASFDGCKTFIEAVNPEIVVRRGKHIEYEGCLSIPNIRERVERPKHVTVHAFDRHGNPIVLKGNGFSAACFCHEIDHLDGILFIDRAIKK